ncbi:MAG: GntR family transcriptional regulator [Pseudomonadota bacterium]
MPSQPDPTPVVFSVSFSEQVYNLVKESILKGIYKPGQKLNEIELCQRLGVSRGPIREAFQRLNQEGLVKLQPHKGGIVPCPSLEEIEALFEVREALEGLAVRLAVERAEREEIRSLFSFLRDTRRAIINDKYSVYPWDHDFHLQIAKCARNPKLEESINKLNSQLMLARHLSGSSMGRANEVCREHMRVVEALQKKDSQRAEEAMLKHLRNSKINILQIFARVKPTND